MSDVHRLPGMILVMIICSWLGGIFLASFLSFPLFVYLFASLIVVLLLIVYWAKQSWRLFLLLLLAFLFGAGRYTQDVPANDPLNVVHAIGSSLEIQGTVCDEPKNHGRVRTLHVAISQVSKNGGSTWYEAHGEIVLQTLGLVVEDPYGANYGDSVSVKGKLQPPLPYEPLAIVASMTFPQLTVSQFANTPLVWLFHFRMLLASTISRALPSQEGALLIALLLSLHTSSLSTLLSVFNQTGTAHLIAPSGLKITILAGIISKLLARLQPVGSRLPAERSRSWQAYCTVLLVILCDVLYTILSGLGPAAIRAGFMGSLLVIAPRLGRTYNIYSALAFTALLMSLYDPLILWDPGFQLSFAGTLGIVVLTPYFQRLLLLLPFVKRSFLGEKVVEICAVTLAAQTATLPFLVIDFQIISFVAPLANIFTVPLLLFFILLGLLLCVLGLIAPPLALAVSWFVYPPLWYTIKILLFYDNLPDAYKNVVYVDNMFSIAYYGLLLLGFLVLQEIYPRGHELPERKPSARIWRIIQICVALLAVLTMTGFDALHFSVHQFTITFLSVGPANQSPEGEAILIQTPDGKSMLIDGGLDATSLGQGLDAHFPYWQRSLDVVLLTTPRPDHLNGLLDILDRYSIGTVVDAGDLHPSTTYALWRRTINRKSMNYLPVQQGMQMLLGRDVTIQVFWPGPTLHKGSNELRDNALVIRILTPFMRVLLLGVTAESNYALQGLLASLDARVMQEEVVQIEGEEGTSFAPLLQAFLAKTHAMLLIETPAAASSRQKKRQVSIPHVPLILPGVLIVKTQEAGSFTVAGDSHGITGFQAAGG